VFSDRELSRVGRTLHLPTLDELPSLCVLILTGSVGQQRHWLTQATADIAELLQRLPVVSHVAAVSAKEATAAIGPAEPTAPAAAGMKDVEAAAVAASSQPANLPKAHSAWTGAVVASAVAGIGRSPSLHAPDDSAPSIRAQSLLVIASS
jgi:hypothetical protein